MLVLLFIDKLVMELPFTKRKYPFQVSVCLSVLQAILGTIFFLIFLFFSCFWPVGTKLLVPWDQFIKPGQKFN